MTIEQLVTTATDHQQETFNWGEIDWLDSHDFTGTDSLTVGKVTIYPGERNSEHFHPNCDESLYVLSGELEHTIENESTKLLEGELIHIPRGKRHRASNTGTRDAVAIIVYDTGFREVEFVDGDSE